jgi:transposase
MKEASQGSKQAEQRSTERLLPIEEWRPAQEESVKQIIATRRAERQGRYQQVTALREQGLTSHEIAARLGMKERTVRDWLHKGIAPDTRPRRKYRSDFDSYAPPRKQPCGFSCVTRKNSGAMSRKIWPPSD